MQTVGVQIRPVHISQYENDSTLINIFINQMSKNDCFVLLAQLFGLLEVTLAKMQFPVQ